MLLGVLKVLKGMQRVFVASELLSVGACGAVLGLCSGSPSAALQMAGAHRDEPC